MNEDYIESKDMIFWLKWFFYICFKSITCLPFPIALIYAFLYPSKMGYQAIIPLLFLSMFCVIDYIYSLIKPWYEGTLNFPTGWEREYTGRK